jgi:hypothetical protein
MEKMIAFFRHSAWEAEILFAYITAKKYVDRESTRGLLLLFMFKFITKGTNRTCLCSKVMHMYDTVLIQDDPVLNRSRVIP